MAILRLAAALLAVAPVPQADAGRPCQECHPGQGSAWQASRHAASTESPLYLAMREWARSDGGEKAAAPCATCHTAAVAGGGRTGAVTCTVCHRGRADSPGPAGWQVVTDAPVAARRVSGEAPHPVEASPLFAAGAVCLVCHGELSNPAGVPLCTTGPEARAAGHETACQDCHAGHAFSGTSTELLAKAATVTVRPGAAGVTVLVVNSGTGHSLPTGPVLRQVRLQVEATDAGGSVVWDNRDDAGATLAKVLQGADGTAPAPPWRATAVRRDTRLGPGEARTFTYPSPEGAVLVTARLVYHRAPAPILDRLGLTGPARPAPVVMATDSATLTAAPPRR